MAWKKHPRLMTDEQFAFDTTIDGNRIDGAMDDTVSRFNNLELRDVDTRLVPCHYVSGFTPQSPTNTASWVALIVSGGTGYSAANGVATTTAGAGTGLTVDILTVAAGVITEVNVDAHGTGYLVGDIVTVTTGNADATLKLYSSTLHHWPWLSTFNWYALTGTGQPDNFLNPNRVKSISVDGIVNKVSAAATWPKGRQYAWTSEWFFGRPVVLDSLHLVAALDNTNTATAEYKPFASSTPFIWPDRYLPANKTANEDHDDMQIIVQVADPFDPRQRSRDCVEVSKHTFPINHNAVSHTNLEAPTSDMTPNYPVQNSIAGAAVQLGDLNIPIHTNAVVRVSVVIPRYDLVTARGFWGYEPWNKMIPTLVMTTLEEIE